MSDARSSTLRKARGSCPTPVNQIGEEIAVQQRAEQESGVTTRQHPHIVSGGGLLADDALHPRRQVLCKVRLHHACAVQCSAVQCSAVQCSAVQMRSWHQSICCTLQLAVTSNPCGAIAPQPQCSTALLIATQQYAFVAQPTDPFYIISPFGLIGCAWPGRTVVADTANTHPGAAR